MKEKTLRLGMVFPPSSPSFPFQSFKFDRIKELPQGDVESFANSLYGHYAGILAFIVQDTFDGGLGDTRDMAQGVGRDVPLPAKLPNPACDSFLCSHGNPSMHNYTRWEHDFQVILHLKIMLSFVSEISLTKELQKPPIA